MKFIKASAVMLEKDYDMINPSSIYSRIESIGRVCYKSEDKITDESNKEFVAKIRNRGHWAVLEHHAFVLRIDWEIYNAFQNIKADMLNHGGVDENEIARALRYISLTLDIDEGCLMSGSATAFNNLWESLKTVKRSIYTAPMEYLEERYPLIMKKPDNYSDDDKILKDFTIMVDGLMSYEEIRNLPYYIRRHHDYTTVYVICDRGVTHEIVRHRPVSYAQDSTRYCNYASGKQGEDMIYILPVWMDEKFLGRLKFTDDGNGIRNLDTGELLEGLTEAELTYFGILRHSEVAYMKLIECGWSPQQARDVLVNSLKTEIYVTAPSAEWEHLFKMRDSTAAHVQMFEWANPMHKEFLDKGILSKV